MKTFSELMGNQKVLPIIQVDNEEQGVKTAQAMVQGGINVVEVVLRTAGSLTALSAIKQAFPKLQVGAGTILNEDTLNKAIEAGADFIITPAITPKLLTALSQCSVPVVPGVSNTADIALAHEFGFREMKLFPASLCGGVAFLKAVSSVFQDVKFCPTGGVNPENLAEFINLPNVAAAGGTWLANKAWIDAEQWQQITQACEQASQI
ncbi:bifunctional 4-hydroxy-2-oxoglutarate aldolase/2-dehydro-3-deoxy-phosphogluconate aldolase [Catenovulum sp. 2E275]|uniref:bifunctional 4-hydroxy-2-oxoglutarate aldolase/2-dehydro-3-deoxy-phosphogluconate aldolase n=1 Tax=Catenovulum sp. 2E275 TaxID=2980497 RepID=UPI0021D37AB5|nr:bifunctional 4-hydroxy-2-oxoglutarate aldolase/2-dehydro-3-deoxy-phosphogluconate aldolase [Catenovulum sp. 2E275]MCU4674016.1 bifunctional 4-hydroxy-2-oxoglutarate aldolase/2-dehydro-3-deoxy-phosphogluconate aldolase [Catenovulum sp. 2E275]